MSNDWDFEYTSHGSGRYYRLAATASPKKPGHLKSECPESLKKAQPRWTKSKQKAMVGTWSEEEDDDDEESSEAEESQSRICLMARREGGDEEEKNKKQYEIKNIIKPTVKRKAWISKNLFSYVLDLGDVKGPKCT
ncbi:hypothetical protein Taro_005582 [Colocasia esculenta]|uniref:Uncharacterized protein n=1 Tax=Colocasia esculenta TaxID=4460 RepID=A0A843TLC6_COLES|nr:hypothetical protein [Colocasia esculenta]